MVEPTRRRAPRSGLPILKMNFIFKIRPAPLRLRFRLAALGSLACRERPAPVLAPDGGDAQRLVSLVDYIAGDYPMAVRGRHGDQPGRIRGAAARSPRTRAGSPASSSAPPRRPPTACSRTSRRWTCGSGRKAPAAAVAEACRAAREEAVARFGLQTRRSTGPPSREPRSSYAASCATCHGARGDADTERARTLDPAPASFRDPARLGDLSPYRVYNALTFGVPGTAMASFDALSPADRWSLAFYVFRLGHDGAPGRGPVAMPLADMATRSDRELRDALAGEGHPGPPAGVVWARREAAFREPPAGVGIDRTRRMVKAAVEAAPRQSPGGGRPPRPRRVPAGLRASRAAAARPRSARHAGGGSRVPRPEGGAAVG